ncbi:MAG: hypothetical protein AB7S37_04650 [Methanobacteriales archaeon]|nr:hypothetical protein [Methanothermobacter sp.]
MGSGFFSCFYYFFLESVKKFFGYPYSHMEGDFPADRVKKRGYSPMLKDEMGSLRWNIHPRE